MRRRGDTSYGGKKVNERSGGLALNHAGDLVQFTNSRSSVNSMG
jgi:hypothetical protein